MSPYVWMSRSNGSVPPDAVIAGKDVDGSTLYAGRAFHNGDLLPAKVSPSHGGAFVAYDGSEHSKFQYEVLCSSRVAWKHSKNGSVPCNAIEIGKTSNGEKLYMGRVTHKCSLTPGKIHPSHKVLYIPFGGKEISFHEYEVLVLV